MIEIGTLGLSFGSGNKGCEALAYSFLEIMETIAAKRNEIIQINFIKPLPTKLLLKKPSVKGIKRNYYPRTEYQHLRFNALFYLYKGGRVFFLNSLKNCRCVFDYTDGDSFTDIYGRDRFFTRTRVKKAVIDKKVPLILGSQTIGPFRDKDVQELAAEVIRKASRVYVRDRMSYDYTLELSGRTPELTSDIAFFLPFEKAEKHQGAKPRLGFNPSGLLWNGGYTNDNQFGLSVDYQKYCREIISGLSDSFEIHLIPHAFLKNASTADNDLDAIRALHEEFPETIEAPLFNTPMEIKSYIAKMDVFSGARMHATIGAFSAGVPVVPFSYSRKFEGLFESLSYPFVIHGKKYDTKEAAAKTIEYVQNYDQLRSAMSEGQLKIQKSNDYLLLETEKIVFTERR